MFITIDHDIFQSKQEVRIELEKDDEATTWQEIAIKHLSEGHADIISCTIETALFLIKIFEFFCETIQKIFKKSICRDLFVWFICGYLWFICVDFTISYF